MWCEFKINIYTIDFIFTFEIVQLVRHIHNQGTSFFTQDSRTLFSLSSKFRIYME
jgi:hypothetical protein